MSKKIFILAGLMLIVLHRESFAGEFYKLYPTWLEYVYRLLILVLITAGLFVCLSIFNTLRGGKFGLPWVLILMAMIAIFIRTLLGVLTVFNIAFFQAVAFAGLDILFFLLLLVSFVLYKVGLK